MYAKYDSLYKVNDDPFVVIQSWLNIVEACLGLLAVLISISGKRTFGALSVVVIQTMTLWKTVIFLMYDHHWTHPDVAKFTTESLLCYTIPSSIWILMPLLTIFIVGNRIINRNLHLKKA